MQWRALEAFLVEKIWGGTVLAQAKHALPHTRIGETWEISTLDEGQSRVQGQQLSDYLQGHLPYLVKLLETTDHLSIQVHPPCRAGVRGKTECWLILDAKPGAGIFLGFKPGVDQQELSRALERGDDVSRLLNFYPVQRGDFFFTPAGSVHAIGKDVLLLEVQQACGITYRLWDWNRVGDDGKPRALHVKEAFGCLNFNQSANTSSYFRHTNVPPQQGVATLVEHPDFIFHVLQLSPHEKRILDFSGKRPTAICMLEGSCMVAGVQLEKFESALGCGAASSFEVAAEKDGAWIAWVE